MNTTELKQHLEIIRELMTLEHFEDLTLEMEIFGGMFTYSIWTEKPERKGTPAPVINVSVTRINHGYSSDSREQILNLELTPDDFLSEKFFPKDDSDSQT